ELSCSLGVDKSNISKYKKILNSKKIVHQGISLNYHKLNLNVHGILFEYPINNTVNIFSKLSDSVFFHSVYTSNVGYKSALSYFVTPTLPQAEEDIHKLSNKICLEESIPSYTIFRFLTETRMKSFNFNFYDYKKGEWNISPIHLKFTLQDIESNLEGYVPIISTDFEKSDYQKLKLNKTGFDILNHILAKRHLSASQIKKDLNLTEKTTQKLVQYLKKNEMYKLRFNPSYIFGLKNVVLFLETSSRNQRKIHKTFSLFPEVYSEQYSSDKGEGIYFVLRIPNELVVDSIETLTNSYEDELEYLFIVDQMYTKRYQLPSEKFETVFQEWKYDSED
ncbi:MAG: hypothetical protein KAU62_11005, partial [Candidatus Heimdallarchaeota archaeon]|nr:hypothetical protein [Candidatus Heimdallarchaeota archaeon]MCK4611674.1 hypothetical protein [Candidatus Heimdallarchaeota archaeon]